MLTSDDQTLGECEGVDGTVRSAKLVDQSKVFPGFPHVDLIVGGAV